MAIAQLFNTGPMVTTDPLASNLVLAITGYERDGVSDQSSLISGSGSPVTVINPSDRIKTSTDQSKYYGSSIKYFTQATSAPVTAYLRCDTGSSNAIGTGDFCVEFWLYVTDFGFDGQISLLYNYALSDSNPSLVNYNTPYIQITGDNWPDAVETRRGIIFYTGIGATKIVQTTSQYLSTGSWYHVAITRASGTNRIFINGINRASASSSYDFTGYIYSLLQHQNSLTSGVHFQDMRIYVGTPKYTTNFTVPPQILL